MRTGSSGINFHQSIRFKFQILFQVYHLCNRHGGGMAFECPGGTRFQQRTMVCDHYNQVKCEQSAKFYHSNLRIGQKHLNFIDDCM
jgi:hypothetical protein